MLSAKIGLQSNGFHFYGYDTGVDTLIERDDIRQNFMAFNPGLRFTSTHTDSSNMNYDISLNYCYFQDRLDVTEHGLNFISRFDKFFRGQIIGADIGVDYYNNISFVDTSNLVFKLSPWFTKADEEWEVFAGFHG